MHVFSVVTQKLVSSTLENLNEQTQKNTKYQPFWLQKLLCNFRFPPEFPPNLCATEVDRFLGKTPGVGGLTCCQTSIPCTPTICPGEAASPWVDKHFRCLWRSELKFVQRILMEFRLLQRISSTGQAHNLPTTVQHGSFGSFFEGSLWQSLTHTELHWPWQHKHESEEQLNFIPRKFFQNYGSSKKTHIIRSSSRIFSDVFRGVFSGPNWAINIHHRHTSNCLLSQAPQGLPNFQRNQKKSWFWTFNLCLVRISKKTLMHTQKQDTISPFIIILSKKTHPKKNQFITNWPPKWPKRLSKFCDVHTVLLGTTDGQGLGGSSDRRRTERWARSQRKTAYES